MYSLLGVLLFAYEFVRALGGGYASVSEVFFQKPRRAYRNNRFYARKTGEFYT